MLKNGQIYENDLKDTTHSLFLHQIRKLLESLAVFQDLLPIIHPYIIIVG